MFYITTCWTFVALASGFSNYMAYYRAKQKLGK